MPLTGTELLAKVHELGDCPKDHLVLNCGYATAAGKPAYTAFYEALLQAKGVALAPPSTAKVKGRGKQPSYEVTINKQGVAPIGGAYTTQAGWGNGDKLRIVVDGSRITLERIATAEAAVSPAEAPAACPAPVGAASPSAGAPEAALAPF